MNITLNKSSSEIQYLCSKDKRLAQVIDMVGEISYTTHDDGFTFLVHEIIEQMLSIKAGNKIYGRLLDLCSGCITPELICSLSDEQIKSIGTSNSKVKYLKSISWAVIHKDIILSELVNDSDEVAYKKLTSLQGVGNWTANMYLLFVLNRQDILPYDDAAFLQSYCWMYNTKDKSKESIIKKCKKWQPYSSIASRYLYRALDTGLTKVPFKLSNTGGMNHE